MAFDEALNGAWAEQDHDVDIEADRRVVMMTTLALIAIVVAIVLVRLGWGGQRTLGPLGWALGAVALCLLTLQDGAWGLSVGVVAGMTAAFVFVLHAGWTSPTRARRAPREAPAISIPHHRRDLARRVAVFALAVPLAFAAAQWLAFGIQAAVRGGAALDADAVALTLFLQPVIWTAILTVQLTRARTTQMVAAPLVAAVAGTMLWGVA